MKILGWEIKASRTTRALASFLGIPNAVWTPRDYANLSREGYQRNSDIYTAVSLITQGIMSVTLNGYDEQGREKRELPDTHPMLRLLRKPNEFQSGPEFMEQLAGYLLLSGNAYIEAIRPRESEGPRELYALRPDRMKVLRGNPQNPIAGYEYQWNGQRITWDQPNGDRAKDLICHIKLFHPLDDWYGLSPIEALAYQIDNSNESKAFNKALLQNQARPSGALSTEGTLSDEQFQQLKKQVDEHYSGVKNAGRPLLLEGGMKWQEMGLSPKLLEMVEERRLNKRDIATAYRVPPEMLGDSSQKTYSNFAEARKSLYTEAVLPTLNRILQRLNTWLAPMFEGA